MAKKKFFKQKREKINLTFDANDRKKFLTGFLKFIKFFLLFY
jgi:dihydrodipicolinate reductase